MSRIYELSEQRYRQAKRRGRKRAEAPQEHGK
jgi:hypothetical protein